MPQGVDVHGHVLTKEEHDNKNMLCYFFAFACLPCSGHDALQRMSSFRHSSGNFEDKHSATQASSTL